MEIDLAELLEAAKRKAIGQPDRIPRRVITVLLLLALTISLGGVWLALRAGIQTSTSSLTYLEPVLTVATSVWTYVFVLAWLSRRILLARDEKYAEQAAQITGYEPSSVRRLSYESETASESTRVIATTDDEPEEIRERIMRALETGEDDTMSLNPEAFETGAEDELLEAGDPVGTYEERYEALIAVLDSLQERDDELQAELDDGTDELLEAEIDSTQVAAALDSDEDRHAPIDLLGDDEQDLADRLDEIIDERDANLKLQEEILAELDKLEALMEAEIETDADETATEETASPDGLRGYARAAAPSLVRGLATAGKFALLAALGAVVYHAAIWAGGEIPIDLVPTAIDTAAHEWRAYLIASLLAGSAGLALLKRREDADESDQEGDPWREQYKLFRLDLASTLDFSELFWTFAIPGLLTVLAILIALGIWLSPLLYLPVFGAGVLVGLLNYVRVSWKRSRRLSALRQDKEMYNWSDVAILVKEVDVPETRVQYAWMSNRRYAHDDREEFADELALRAYEKVNGVEVSPSIMEKEAKQLERMQPDLHGFRDAEKEHIMRWLLDRVEGAQHGLVPKAKLIEDCIEHDIEARRIGPNVRGKGYDPELVREAYRELVPAALVEQEIALEEGSDETVTAVRHRRDPLPPEYGQIRAQFSSQFGNYARWDPMYELPDVSDRLDTEPTYASTIGYRGDPS